MVFEGWATGNVRYLGVVFHRLDRQVHVGVVDVQILFDAGAAVDLEGWQRAHLVSARRDLRVVDVRIRVGQEFE